MEKKIQIAAICSIIIFVIACLCQCTTTGNKTADIGQVEQSGWIAVGQLRAIYSEFEANQSRARSELETITGTAKDLRSTVQQLIEFSQGLLDSNSDLERKLKALTEDSGHSANNSNSVDSTKNH